MRSKDEEAKSNSQSIWYGIRGSRLVQFKPRSNESNDFESNTRSEVGRSDQRGVQSNYGQVHPVNRFDNHQPRANINGMVNKNIMVHTAVEETPGQGEECPVTGAIPDTRLNSYHISNNHI